MRSLIHMTALIAATAAGSAFADTYSAGLAPLVIADAQSTRPLEGVIWYPASDAAPQARVQSNPVWVGVHASESAPVAQGRFPLVALSHGMYGNHRNQNWLASDLAKAGYIVAIIDHPGTSTWLRDADQARQLWERPRDISRSISYLLDSSPLEGQIDADRIYMAGHSLGGMTAVSLAGGRIDPDHFDAFCATGADPFVCNIMHRWNIAKTPEDREEIAKDYTDDRIKAFAVFDLGGTQFFSADSLRAITSNMLVIGAPKHVTQLNLDLESRDLNVKLEQAQVTYLEPRTLSHFDFLGICTSKALAILAEEEPEDVIVCQDGTAERTSDHSLIVEAVKTAFSKQ